MNSDYYNNSNGLCPFEIALINAYNHLGRPDLAAFVEKGKKFQRVYDSLDGSFQSVERRNAIRRAFLGLQKGEVEPRNEEEWLRRAVERYKDDSGLQQLLSKLGILVQQ